MRNNLLLCAFLLLCFGCGDPAVTQQKEAHPYFDLKGYFAGEATRLSRGKPMIHKTVVVNDSTESKDLVIQDWPKELSIFSDADLNKSAWKGLFQVKKTDTLELYTSNNEKVPVKELKVIKRKGRVYGLQVLIRNSNTLYTSSDTLSYFPDSLYDVKKDQQIRLLAEKNYRITGKFK
ncbi:hypothetical protein OQX61_10830 [Pedobacter sp. PLR]|uniref:hypothetical protein n=1 Tax=Pedobacter sp. PLR TaxID=2994465 RepID=UPI002245F544|nr:hypothetical protein [Pedobacter sp. PLR]MCX2451754.1 hypothetical protein [Pedobacter sp. PLR]